MQAQATRTTTQAITSAQSLAAVQTLLRAGLGCITYLRDLLPEDNFSKTHLITEEDASFSSQDSESGSFSSLTARPSRSGKGFQIMTMTRGYSDEADKILNYLESGIFDALSKRFLRSFIFAIYLDSKDPNKYAYILPFNLVYRLRRLIQSIVEAYTFNFQYHTLPDSGVVVPIMTLGDDLKKMSLKDRRKMQDDPVAAASRAGKVPTLLDVKKSVKVLLKTLINAITQMEQLPKRRYATFKLFYTDNTPSDYEPPHFQAGDVERDKWFFMTHDMDESPEKLSIGKVDTGHHCINLSVTSIASYLPSSQNNDAAFVGTASQLPKQNLSPMEEAALRAHQAEEQAKDAAERNVAWSGEDSVELADMDADGEDDPDYVLQPDGTYMLRECGDGLVPVGIRNNVGDIVPVPEPMVVDEAQFVGANEQVPTKIIELNKPTEVSNLTQTQELGGFTQMDAESDYGRDTPCPEGRKTATTLGLVKSSPTLRGASPMEDASDIEEAPEEDIHAALETLNLETQFESQIEDDTQEGELTPRGVTPAPPGRDTIMKEPSTADLGLKCSCEIDSEEQPCCFCEGCGRWYHVWCIGYHSIKDKRLPGEYICFDCRAHADSTWELIKGNIYAAVYSRYQDLALFRRAIKITEHNRPETFAEFAKIHGSRIVLARQLFKRLETEGFIVEHVTAFNDFGVPETRAKAAAKPTKGKAVKTKKNAQKQVYRLNREMLKSQQYSDYFNPDPKVENSILGLMELVASRSTAPRLPNSSAIHDQQDETQPETQVTNLETGRKRASSADGPEKPKKKIKISVAHGLDLAE